MESKIKFQDSNQDEKRRHYQTKTLRDMQTLRVLFESHRQQSSHRSGLAVRVGARVQAEAKRNRRTLRSSTRRGRSTRTAHSPAAACAQTAARAAHTSQHDDDMSQRSGHTVGEPTTTHLL